MKIIYLMVKQKNSQKPKGKSFDKLLAMAILISIALFILGVGGRMINTKKSQDSEISNSKETGDIFVEDGKPDTREQQLPDDFPQDFPIYEDAVLVNSWVEAGIETKGVSVIWETNSTVNEVSLFYNMELKNTDWEIVSSFDSEESLVITFRKNGIDGFVGVAAENDMTIISVTMGID